MEGTRENWHPAVLFEPCYCTGTIRQRPVIVLSVPPEQNTQIAKAGSRQNAKGAPRKENVSVKTLPTQPWGEEAGV